jgi:4-alpha-glucanotransferase
MIQNEKRIGTLLPMTALVSSVSPSGTFATGGKFVEWLIKSEQTAWQLLPLHQTQLQKGFKSKHVPSPYKGYGIGLDPRFLSEDARLPSAEEIRLFVKANKDWIGTYTLFCALRDNFGTDNWSQWPLGIRERKNRALLEWTKKLAPAISGHLVVQVQLHLAYEQLQEKAKSNNILLIGDMPFYIGLCSPLVWEYQKLFEIEQDGELRRVSGVLTGIKSHFGRQIWGHPLYKWQDQEILRDLLKLFKIRIKYLASLFDMVRFDHAKGLFIYGVIDMIDHKEDLYQVGPGRPFLEKLIKFARTKKLKIYAEDTGDSLKDLRSCLHTHHLPGVKIFRFAYNEKRMTYSEQYLHVSQYPVNTVAYTTTHDTEPLLAYLEKLSPTELMSLMKKLHLKTTLNLKGFAEAIRNKVIMSPAKIVIVPLQDWLLTKDRINTPGTERERNDPNWQYVMDIPIEELSTELHL